MTRNRPDDFEPQAPAYVVEQLPDSIGFSMIVARGADRASTVDELRRELTDSADRPDQLERARVINSDGDETVFICYWNDPDAQRRWYQSAASLARPGVLAQSAVFPSTRCETIYAKLTDAPGLRRQRDLVLTEDHGYWGASRDRIADSEFSDLAAEPGSPLPGNLCLLRGGQMWDNCSETEKEMFFADVEPRLTKAVEYLSSHPESGCLEMTYMHDQSLDGEDLLSSSFVAWFREHAALEAWTSGHEGHLGAFGAFVDMVITLGLEFDTQIWHEVAVVPAGGVHIAGTEPSPLLA